MKEVIIKVTTLSTFLLSTCNALECSVFSTYRWPLNRMGLNHLGLLTGEFLLVNMEKECTYIFISFDFLTNFYSLAYFLKRIQCIIDIQAMCSLTLLSGRLPVNSRLSVVRFGRESYIQLFRVRGGQQPNLRVVQESTSLDSSRVHLWWKVPGKTHNDCKKQARERKPATQRCGVR